MPAQRSWTVTPHDSIVEHEDNLWSVEGMVPGVRARRRMFIVKRADGTLLFSGAAIPLKALALDQVMAWGRPKVLVVPHHWHMIDASPFAERLGLDVYGPRACEDKIRQRLGLTGVLEDLPIDPHLSIEPVAGTRMDEPALLVRSDGGRRVSLLLADVIQNIPKGSLPMMFRLLGLEGGPKVTRAFRLFFLRDRRALSIQVQRWSEIPGLVRLVPCHGGIVDQDPRRALQDIARSLNPRIVR
jgi:hypothetical protein